MTGKYNFRNKESAIFQILFNFEMPKFYSFHLYFLFHSLYKPLLLVKDRAKSHMYFAFILFSERRALCFTFKFKTCKISFLSFNLFSFYLLYTPLTKWFLA